MKRLVAILFVIFLLGTVTAHAGADISWSKIAAPVLVYQGESYLVSGEVTSPLGKLTEVRYRIKDKDWKTVQEKSLSMSTGKHNLENSSTKCISFESLPEGRYTLIVNATAVVFGSTSTRTIINQEFKVIGNSSQVKLTSKDVNCPKTLKVGDNFGLRGILTAEEGVIGAVYGTIKDSKGNTVLSGTVKPNTKTHDIKEKNSINDQIKFGKLSPGEYTYTLAAVVIRNKTIPVPSTVTIIEKTFKVEKNSSGSATTKPPAPNPVTPQPFTPVPSTATPSTAVPPTAAPAKTTPPPTIVTEYRYRDAYGSYSDWSPWGEWLNADHRKDITDPNTMEEQAQTKIRWWAAKCTKCGTHNPYHGSKAKCNGCGITLYDKQNLWVTVRAWSDDSSGQQSIYGRKDGRYFNGQPYWGPEKKTAYRYRTRNGITVWGEWSSWSVTKPASQPNRQIEERTIK